MTDDSGTLAGCHLSGDVADSLLGCTVTYIRKWEGNLPQEVGGKLTSGSGRETARLYGNLPLEVGGNFLAVR